MSNNTLHKAKAAKDDEFYTQLSDIEKELNHYEKQFRGKVVLCNCDDPEQSSFWKFFKMRVEFWGIKKLISTHYAPNGGAYKLETTSETGPDIKTPLSGNGDFRSEECVALLKEADIVATNPPFSLFREYIALLVEHGKKFIVIGNYNAVTYKEIFPLIKANKLWLGVMPGRMDFLRPDGATKRLNNVAWFTNMPNRKRKEKRVLVRRYNAKDYPKYDNYDAIEVSRLVNIPEDYAGHMGVPITFLESYNPEQFEVVGATESEGVGFSSGLWNPTDGVKQGVVNGRRVYKRVFIRNKQPTAFL